MTLPVNPSVPSPIYEPPIQQGDTKPRAPILLDEPRAGCGARLFGLLIFLVIACMFATTVGLAGFAGYRDGGKLRQQQKSVALDATLNRQATLAWDDLNKQQYDLGLERCRYVVTAQPNYPQMPACISTAQAGLSATATFTPTVPPTLTPIPPSQTPQAVATDANSAGQNSAEGLFNAAQASFQSAKYEDAEGYLEALRGQDSTYRRAEVEDLLVQTYLTLATQYKASNDLSLMVIVVEKAGKIRSLDGTDWVFTVNVTKLYLSAKGYLDAQNYALAAQVFRTLMAQAPSYLDTKTLACEAFSKAGDSAASAQYACN